jgi:D-3-phosphoglycerate dehydrogenase
VSADPPLVVGLELEWQPLDLEAAALAEVGAVIEWRAPCRTEDEVLAAARGAVGLVNEISPITRRVLEQLPDLRVVSEAGVGWDFIDVEAAAELGIWVTSVPGYCTAEVADHTLALALALVRRLPDQRELVRAGSWNSLAAGTIPRLAGSTWGIVGFGRIGQAVAARARALGFRVVALDPYVPDETFAAAGVERLGLDDLLRASDVVSLHSPRTDETVGMIGRRELSLLKPTAVLVNVARGHLIDETALVEALDAGAFVGAGLDVLVGSPPGPDHPLVHHPRAIVTPHMAWYSEGAFLELRRRAVQAVVDVLAGRRPRDPVAEPRG